MTDFPSSPESSTLKPCPFCGSTDIMEGVYYAEGEAKKRGAVRCAGCGVRGPTAVWNRRFDFAPTPKDTMRAALESALEYVESDLRERFSVSGQNVRDEIRAALSDTSTDRPVSFCSRCSGRDPDCYICGVSISSPDRCQVCGEPADLTCGPSRFGDKTWACKDCWEPDCSIIREAGK